MSGATPPPPPFGPDPGPQAVPQGYWWQCVAANCLHWRPFADGCAIAHFLWDPLLASDWNQALLLHDCPLCGEHTFRITYHFPGQNPITIHVLHILGVAPDAQDYLPMMWETYPATDEGLRWFDFKYIIGRRPFGLNRPAVLTEGQLGHLLCRYQEIAGNPHFPFTP